MAFGERWQGGDKAPLSRQVREAIHPPGPLKPRLDFAVKGVKAQLTKLDKESERLEARDKDLFNKVVNAYTAHDSARAKIYANELAQLRKTSKLIINSKLALDQIVLRVEAVSELGDVAYTLLPVINVMRDVRNGMSSVNPQIARELGDISNLLSGIVMDAGANGALSINFGSANEDAAKIMEEAAAVAEGKMKDTFPELPGGIQLK